MRKILSHGLAVLLLAVSASSADNTTLNPGAGGDSIRAVEKSSKKAQVVVLDVGGSGTENIGAACGVEDAAETAAGNLFMCGTVRRDTAASSAGTSGDNATLNTDADGKLWTAGGYLEDAGESVGGVLVMSGTVRRDAAATSAGTDGDNATLNTDATGRLWMTGIYLEDVAETAAGQLMSVGTVRRDTKASSAGTTGDHATLNTDANGGLWLAADIIEDVAETAAAPLVGVGTVRRDTAASSAGTTGDNATLNTDAVGAVWSHDLSIGVEDSAETSAGSLGMVGTVRRDTKASSAGTTGDNATLNTDANGGLWLAADVVEDAAETVAAPLVGVGTVRRDTAASSAGTDGDNATLNTDATGRLWVSGTQIEDVAETAAGQLLMVGTVRRDTAASSAGTTGDNATLNTDANGNLWVVSAATTNAGSTAVVEDAAETAAGNLVPIATVRRDTKASSAGTTGDNATLNTDANGGLWMAADVVEDAAETAAAPLTGVGTVRRDTAASSAGTTGDNATLNTDATGHLWVMPNILTVAGTTAVVEDAGETAAGNLVPIGAVRRDTQASSGGTTGDNVTLNTDNLGALYTTETGHQAVASGIITVTTAGTSVQGATVTTKQCWFQTAAGATGTNCFLGAATGDNRNKGLMLIKGAVSVGPIPIQNLNLVWADCATSGDTVQYFCTN